MATLPRMPQPGEISVDGAIWLGMVPAVGEPVFVTTVARRWLHS